jgi:hypothetical protein
VHEDLEDDKRHGQPSTAPNPETVAKIDELVARDC